jgi:hypothetical protein
MILVLLDFDGVIVDTQKKSYEIFSRCLNKIESCNNIKLINILYNRANGLNLLSISKFLESYFKTNYLKFYSFLKKEWQITYAKLSLDKNILNFFNLLNCLNTKIVFFSSSDKKNINLLLKSRIKNFYYIKKYFNKDRTLSEKTLKKINKIKKNCNYFINIDDSKFINDQLSKLNFKSIHFQINKNKQTLSNFFFDIIFKQKIDFFFKFSNSNFDKINFLNYSISKKTKNNLNNKLKKVRHIIPNNEKLCFINNFTLNKNINVYGFNHYYSARFLKKFPSIGVQGFIIIDNRYFLVGKRKSSMTEKNKYEVLPAGGLQNFSYNFLFLQLKKECFEETGLKINNNNIQILALYIDFKENVLDFIFEIKIENLQHIKSKLKISEEHSKFLVIKKNYCKKNINRFTNSSKKVITNYILNEEKSFFYS